MSHYWLFDALLCILMPTCLSDNRLLTDSYHRRLAYKASCGRKQIALRMCFCPFYQSSAAKVNQSRPPSQLITVLSCHIIRQRGVGERRLNFETDRPSAGCQMVSAKWPAYSPPLSTCCRRLPLTETHQCKSQTERRMRGDTCRQRAGPNGFTYVVTQLDTFSQQANELNQRLRCDASPSKS